MRHTCRLVPCLAAALFACGQSHAVITIKKADGTLVPNGSTTIAYNLLTMDWDIHLLQLYAPNQDTVYEIHGNAGETINLVSIDVNGPAAGSPVLVRVLGDAPGSISTVRSIIETGSAETILNKVQVAQDIGSITVEAIGDLIAGRDILGPVIATTGNNTTRGVNIAQANRHVLGDVQADNGRIMLVKATTGNIGTAFTPVSIRARHSVYHVSGNDVYANIQCRYNGGAGGSWALVADRFFGTLDANNLIFNTYNGLDARYLISQQFTGRITIGKSYSNVNQYIELPPTTMGGIAGQIIINADNVAGGTWTAPVRLGPVGGAGTLTLPTPRYPQTAASIGGGAVGLVPFRLHDQSCFPVNGTSATVQIGGNPLTVFLRHYGPLVWNQSPRARPAPVTIERRPKGSAQSYTIVPSIDFAFTPYPGDAKTLLVGPAPNKPGFAPGYDYRIRPTAQLQCDVSSHPAVIWDSDYLITVNLNAPKCTGDIDNSGAVDISDLLAVINNWGPVNQAFPQADINHDNVVNIEDLLMVIQHWGACP